MDNKFEKPNIVFIKDTGKETKLQVVSELLINSGGFGDIYDSVLDVGGHKKNFIVKKYRDNPELSLTPEENAQKAFENYSFAKKARLKVFPTFRISEDGKNILMTTGSSDKQICVGSNTAKNILSFGQPLIDRIQDVDKFLSNFFNEGLIAAQNKMTIHDDVPFFIISNKSTKIDFVLGDFDNLSPHSIGSKKYIGLQNMSFLKKALIDFCEKNINPSRANFFLDRVEHFYKLGVNKVNISQKLK